MRKWGVEQRYYTEVMANQIIDREEEQRRLQELASDPPRLVILRGRRRIGKSFLLTQTLGQTPTVFFQADQQPPSNQLQLFAQELTRLIPGNPPLSFPDWDEALTYLGKYTISQPLTVVLDEFQYLCSGNEALPSIIQRHWDQWQRDDRKITLILCGSALSFMENLLTHGNPLFGRADYRPLLGPLDYRDAANFAHPKTSPIDLLRRYAILGGTPQYQKWAGHSSYKTFIRDHILSKGASLYEEPLHLVREETDIRNPGTYFSLLHGIAQGRTTLGSLASWSDGAETTANTTRRLYRLMELGYVQLCRPLQSGKPPRRTSYQIKDSFFRFWFRFVFPNRSRLEHEHLEPVLEKVLADFDTYMGPAYEEFCRHWLQRYADFPLAQQITNVGRWWARDGQDIDIVAMRKDDYLLLGSCKWKRTVDVDVLDQLHERSTLLGGKARRAQLLLFARDSFTKELKARAQAENVLLFTAKDLFI